MEDTDLETRFASDIERRSLRHKLEQAELALKSDLGIYIVEFADIEKRFSRYQEIVDEVGREGKDASLSN